MNAISAAPSMKFTGTSTTPTRAAAKFSTANCQQLWHSSASRSPLASPAAAIAAAVRSTTASSSAKVSRVPGPVDDGELVRRAARRTTGQVAERLLAGVGEELLDRHGDLPRGAGVMQSP